MGTLSRKRNEAGLWIGLEKGRNLTLAPPLARSDCQRNAVRWRTNRPFGAVDYGTKYYPAIFVYIFFIKNAVPESRHRSKIRCLDSGRTGFDGCCARKQLTANRPGQPSDPVPKRKSKILTIASIKGGVGKSTIAYSLWKLLKKALGVDADPQANFTDAAMRDVPLDHFKDYSSRQMFLGTQPAADCIHGRFVPSVMELRNLNKENALQSTVDRLRNFERVRSELLELVEYDWIIVDSIGAATYEFEAAIAIADIVLAPTELDRWAIRGLALMREEIDEIAAQIEKSGISGLRCPPELVVVPSRVTPSQADELMDLSGKRWRVTKTFVPRAAPIKTAVNTGRPLKATYAETFEALVRELA